MYSLTAFAKHLLLALLILLPALPCVAQHDHEPLALSAELSFQDMLAATLQHAPEIQEAAVREQQAADYANNASSWLAGRPSVAMNYLDDRRLTNRGQVETEVGVQLPLWRPGAKQQSIQLGKLYKEQSGLWQEALTLSLAGKLRDVLAAIHEAEAMLELEQQATATATELLNATKTLFSHGAVAKLDVMNSENLELEQRKRLFDAQAALADAERQYSVLTGLKVRPSMSHVEILSTQEEVEPNHPLLQFLQSSIALAEGSVNQSENTAKGNPQLSVGTRHQRGDRFSPWDDTLAISLTIPFGGKSFVAATTSTARRLKTEADVQYLTTKRTLELDLHEAEHQLFVLEQQLPLAEQQATLADQRSSMAQLAFAQGEITLVQVLPAVQDQRVATRELESLRLKQQRLITVYNQVIGVLP